MALPSAVLRVQRSMTAVILHDLGGYVERFV